MTSNIVYCYYIEEATSERTLAIYGVRGLPGSPARNSSNSEPDVPCGELLHETVSRSAGGGSDA